MHQVDEAKFRQQVGNYLAARILGIIQVHIEIYQRDKVLTPEARQYLLYIGELVQCGRQEVCSNWYPYVQCNLRLVKN